MTRKLPVLIQDQDGHQYHVKVDKDQHCYIILRGYEKRLSVNNILEETEGFVWTWGMHGDVPEFIFTIVKNELLSNPRVLQQVREQRRLQG